jgi:dienelactone hydrolase
MPEDGNEGMRHRNRLLITGVVVGLTACDGGGDATPITAPERTVEMVADVIVADGLTTADVYRPTSGEGMPVVVMLHGTAGDRTEFDGLAREVAASGAVVYVPTWPVIAEMPDEDEVGELWRQQTETVVCSLRHARATAADFGGDPDDLTVVGHSGGATVGARVALVAEPPWPGIDCHPGVSHAPRRFISTGADFTGSYSYATTFSDEYEPYDVFTIEPTNEVQVRLIHGFDDFNTDASTDTAALDERLAGLSVDSTAVYLDSAHGDLIDMSEPTGQFVADQVVELLHGRPGVFGEGATAASLTYETEQCSYDGPTALGAGEPLAIELRNRADVPVLFWMVGFDQGVEVLDSDLFERLPLPLDDTPEYVKTGRWVEVPAGTTGLLRWVLVRGNLEWTPFCYPEAASSDPGAGLMHAEAVVLTMEP